MYFMTSKQTPHRLLDTFPQKLKSSKFAAYCAIVLSLTGCATPKTQVTTDDELAQPKVVERSKQIKSLKQAQMQEAAAIAKQNQADTDLLLDKAACLKVFLVNRCIDKASATRNATWDAAQIERTSARYYIRQYEANARRTALAQKLEDYRRSEAAQAPARAASKAAYESKIQAYNAKLANPDTLSPEERAQNVTLYNQKRTKILEMQKKRADAEQARIEAAKNAAKAAQAAQAAALANAPVQ
ncbi:hypothetical protein [Hydromonas duriensis]|uniref:Uncharacterized protein n=1 Tax=Hydromonas duriensis TaxID=1527608 RepID=A0A4R6Y9X2_9BURK|nr:hypothetical protein [Hydromonas duriensis]TDR32323.1 hypothetical protein DFR44_10437 [Hydromonas duriensis]